MMREMRRRRLLKQWMMNPEIPDNGCVLASKRDVRIRIVLAAVG